MKARKLAVLVTAVLAACSDGGTGPSNEAAAFTAEQSAYTPYQVAVLTLNGAAPAEDVQGTFGTEPVTLMPVGDSTVALMVPAVSGVHALEFAVGSRTYRGSMTVTSMLQVQDPEAYLAAFAAEAAVGIEAVEAEITADGTAEENARALELLQVARDSLALFETRLASLTPDQAQQAADMLRANRMVMEMSQQRALAAGVVHGTAYGAIPQRCSQQSTALKAYKCTWDEFILAMADATIGLAGGALAAKVLAPVPLLGLVVGSALAIEGTLDAVRALKLGGELLKIHGMIAAEIAKATGELIWEGGSAFFRAHIYNPDGFALGGMAPPVSMESFTNGGMATFTFAPQMRPVRALDRALPVDWLSQGLALVNRYNRLIGRLGTRFQLQFAASTTSYAPDVPHEEIDIEVVQNQNVRVKQLTGSGSFNSVTFETDQPGEQKFTYDIIYSSGVFPDLRVRYEATLHQPTYTIGSVRDTTIIGDTVSMYGRVVNLYFLMHDDGSLPPNEGFYLNTTTTVPSHIMFMLAGNGGHYVNLQGYLMDPQIVADTFTVDMTNHGGKLMDLTVIMHDSAGVYGTNMTGQWVKRYYNGSLLGFHRTTERVSINADGTYVVHSSTTHSTNAPDDTDYTQRSHFWRIDVELVDGRPIHRFREHTEGWAWTYPVTYPVTTFTAYDSYLGQTIVFTRS